MRFFYRRAPRNPGLPLVAICILSIALGFSLAANYYHTSSNTALAAPEKAPSDDWRTAFVDIAERMAPSVVNITSERMVERPSFPGMDDFFNWPFGPRRQPREQRRSLYPARGKRRGAPAAN